MSTAPIQAKPARFVTKTFDKFKERTDTSWKDPMGGRLLGVKWAPTFWLQGNSDGDKSFNDSIFLKLRYCKFPGTEAIVIDYTYQGIDWKFLRNGDFRINLDDLENVVLLPTETSTDTINNSINPVHVKENGFYTITQEDLKKICDAKKISARITGDSLYMDILGGNLLKLQFMCRSFYAEVFNDHTYDEWINTIVPVGSEEMKDKAWYLILGYLCFWFLFPVTFGIGLYLVLNKKKFSDGEKKYAFSTNYRINGAVMIAVAIAVFIYVWVGMSSMH